MTAPRSPERPYVKILSVAFAAAAVVCVDGAVLAQSLPDIENGRYALSPVGDEIGAAYEQNRQDALASDVFGSPVYVLDGEVFWGQDRIELLADALKSGRAPYRSQV